MPETLLDAKEDCYAKEDWHKVTDETIKQVFIQADLRINLYSAVTETVDINKLLKFFKNFNIAVTKQDINEFVAIDDKQSFVPRRNIRRINLLFEEQQAVNQDENRRG